MTSKKEKKKEDGQQLRMFQDHETLPLFSGTVPRAVVDPFVPQPAPCQDHLPGMQPGWIYLPRAPSGVGDADAPAPLLDAIQEVGPGPDETGEGDE